MNYLLDACRCVISHDPRQPVTHVHGSPHYWLVNIARLPEGQSILGRRLIVHNGSKVTTGTVTAYTSIHSSARMTPAGSDAIAQITFRDKVETVESLNLPLAQLQLLPGYSRPSFIEEKAELTRVAENTSQSVSGALVTFSSLSQRHHVGDSSKVDSPTMVGADIDGPGTPRSPPPPLTRLHAEWRPLKPDADADVKVSSLGPRDIASTLPSKSCLRNNIMLDVENEC